MFSPLFNTKKITVAGNEKITDNEIISLSQIELEENTFKIVKSKVIEKIKQNAYIDKVKITRKLPSELYIEIVERKVNFQLEYAGSYMYINNQGYMLEISTNKAEVPIIQGAETGISEYVVGNRLSIKDLEKLEIVLRIMESASSYDIESLITRIDMESSSSYKIILEGEQKTVYLGDGSNLNTRMLNAKAMIEQEKGIAGEIYVDMDLNNEHPFFRQRV